MVKVKICGITRPEDALFCAEAGADYVGLVLYPRSPRYVNRERRREILKALEGFGVKKVAVVVNEEPSFLKELLEEGFDFIQLHGEEPPEVGKELGFERVIKAFRVRENTPDVRGWERAHALLLDTYSEKAYGGTGKTFNWEIAKELVEKGYRIFLSGGLNPENVERAVREVRPYCVDVSSGVEKEKGIKDHEKVRFFLERAKSA
ncbi:MAG: phosphoribosylanthranilate isomerase [Aquificae bacterium]|nr:phosphoribosylanthranilate isomerase [Aquificota bacterium]